jgi:hypothetical protein
MKDMKRPLLKTRSMGKMTVSGKTGMMLRRAGNHNTHIITPHGKIQSGRKGRKG